MSPETIWKAEAERLARINGDLLAALEGLLAVPITATLPQGQQYLTGAIQDARAAISKAKGE